MKSILRYTLIILATGVFISCKKFLDVNENPNAATRPPINGLLIRTTQNTGLNVFRVSNITSYYVQYLASPNPSSSTDIYDPIDASETWTKLYDNMTDLYDMQKFGEEQKAWEYQGVAKIMMAMNLQLVHNLWGDAPYSKAFSGETLTTEYDDAQAIFQTCLTLLDDGITLLQKPGSAVTLSTDADLIHGGSTEGWIRTAHALKARLLNQLSKTTRYSPAAIFTELSAAYTANAQDAFITTFDIRNPWNQVAVDNADLVLDGWLSKYYVDAMNGTTFGIADPRLPLTASLTKFGDFRGTRNGAGRVGSGTDQEESYVSLTGYYSDETAPLYIITYDEMKFIEAEAAFRNNDKPRAYAAYLAAITANITKMGLTASGYVSDPTVAVGANNLTLALIFKEKYKALFLMPVAWDDARRFDYAYLGFQLPLNAVEPVFVRRLVYPSVETSRNSATVPVVTDVTQKLWWDN